MQHRLKGGRHGRSSGVEANPTPDPNYNPNPTPNPTANPAHRPSPNPTLNPNIKRLGGLTKEAASVARLVCLVEEP